MVVVDGATPELADDAAKRLVAALKDRRDLFRTARWPSGGPFFEREGLLFFSLEDVRATTDGLVKAAPMLVRLRADQSLRGVLVVLSDMVHTVRAARSRARHRAGSNSLLGNVRERCCRPAGLFSWRTFFIGKKSTSRETRHILLVQPGDGLCGAGAGAAASDAIRHISGRSVSIRRTV